jgi:uncharacterized LabA/DUF88 family protein
MAMSRGKTICFIDNANVFHGQQESGWRIDWQKFGRFLDRDGEIWQTYFFASENDPPLAGETAFYDFLKEKLRWEISIYTLGRKTFQCESCNHKHVVPAEKGVDVGLAIKMLMLGVNQAYDTAVLVAGDRDYLEAVQFVKGLGKRVEVIAWRNGLSDALAAESSSPIIYLDDLKDEVLREFD